ncbi:hypothetical protein L1987_42456 [Smallanthus sonchifolius]|uniref:Uncharacterized protein n=1 Tax=Smallanthus sonchifolius TaxID=185202 RepID=A0ACB9GIZ4_9ASTR|nr:hypothetical protein L1987_42456 [Smallanthus sonchifolius]
MAQIAKKSTTNSFAPNGSSSAPGPSFSSASSGMASEVASPLTDEAHISKRTSSVPTSAADIPIEVLKHLCSPKCITK